MLSGPSFSSAFIFSRNSLFLSEFPFTSFHVVKPCNLLYRGFILLCVQLSKNITECLLWLYTFLVLILQSTYIICTAWKRKQALEQQPYRECEWTNSGNPNKSINKSCNIQIDHLFYLDLDLLFDLGYKQCFTVWRQSQYEDFLSIIS